MNTLTPIPQEPEKMVWTEILQGKKILFKPLEKTEEYLQCLDLQKKIWGEETEHIPLGMMKITQRIGGLCAGALDTSGNVIGFGISMPGFIQNTVVHWSYRLGVDPGLRDLSLGTHLKRYQRLFCQRSGIEWIYWTYDPLVARNAHLNLNKLGTKIVQYIPDLYEGSTSVLHSDFGTDRFVVAWHTLSSENFITLSQKEWKDQIENYKMYRIVDYPEEMAFASSIRIEIPENIISLKTEVLSEALRWRSQTRTLFLKAVKEKWNIIGFYRDPETTRCYYVLKK